MINFEKYLHFRRVQNQDKIDLINMGEAVMNHNFLDSLDQDKVIGKIFFNWKDSWSIQIDSTRTIANLRSLIWPGYFAFNKSNSKQFGSVYIGFGIKNMDISFMQ